MARCVPTKAQATPLSALTAEGRTGTGSGQLNGAHTLRLPLHDGFSRGYLEGLPCLGTNLLLLLLSVCCAWRNFAARHALELFCKLPPGYVCKPSQEGPLPTRSAHYIACLSCAWGILDNKCGGM